MIARDEMSGTYVAPVHDPAARLPNFIVIGAMKSGTTSLFHYLQSHPRCSCRRSKRWTSSPVRSTGDGA